MPVETELYDILGVKPDSSQQEIKKAFKKLSLEKHPDKGGDSDEYKKITGAYELLGNPEKRKKYDQYGKNNHEHFSGFNEDIFNNLFNGMNSFSGMFNFMNKQRKPVKSPPIHHHYNATLEQLCQRKIIKLKFNRTILCDCYSKSNYCQICNGSGLKVETRHLGPGIIQQRQLPCDNCNKTGYINIGCEKCKKGLVLEQRFVQLHLTPEIEAGYHYTFHGEGNQTDKDTTIGDFIVIINIKHHPLFHVSNKNIIYNKTITLKEALTGYTEILTHPNGENIHINTNGNILFPNSNFIVNGKGMTDNGNFIINIKISFPKNLTQHQINTLKQIL